MCADKSYPDVSMVVLTILCVGSYSMSCDCGVLLPFFFLKPLSCDGRLGIRGTQFRANTITAPCRGKNQRMKETRKHINGF